jgi:hypothetical protein
MSEMLSGVGNWVLSGGRGATIGKLRSGGSIVQYRRSFVWLTWFNTDSEIAPTREPDFTPKMAF